MKEIPRFCRNCGSELRQDKVRADKVRVEHCYGGDCYTCVVSSAFNEKTGEENIALVLTCPNYKKNWLGSNGHDKITSYDNDLFY